MINEEKKVELLREEINQAMFNMLILSSSITSLVEMLIVTDEDKKIFHDKIESNLRKMEKEITDSLEEISGV